MRVLFNLYGTVLLKDARRPPLKVPEKLAFLVLFVLNSIYPPHVMLRYQQGKVRWQNSSVEKPWRPGQSRPTPPIREIQIAVGSHPVLVNTCSSEVSPKHPWSG